MKRLNRPQYYATMDQIERARTIHYEINVYKLSLGQDSVRGRVSDKALTFHFRAIADASMELYETYKAIGPDWQSYVFNSGSGIFL